MRDSVRQVHALTPPDLAWWNPNACHGDYSGSAELHQNLLWRPGRRPAGIARSSRACGTSVPAPTRVLGSAAAPVIWSHSN